MASVLVLGSTGMVGSHILSTLRQASVSEFAKIDVVARRSPPALASASVPVSEHIEKDTTTWSATISSLSPPPSIFFSALATTRAAAGGFDKQYKIEHDLNVELAKTAKQAGTKTYVLISAAGSNAKSMVGYTKMKGEIEEHIKEIGFDHTIIVQPGLVAGYREESRPAEAVVRKIAAFAGAISSSLKDFWAQDADVIARAAIHAAVQVEKGEVKDKVWVIGSSEIMRLGKAEWKDLK